MFSEGQLLKTKRGPARLTREPRDAPQFYLTSPSACPYLPSRQERKVFTHLIGRRAVALNDQLTQSGFRRSQTIAYRPACENCRACVSVRIKADEFRLSRNFRRYLDARHGDGGMADMTAVDYATMIEDSHVETRLVEYRLSQESAVAAGKRPLLAACLTDLLADGLSMVYSFYVPGEQHRSFGTYMILDHIERARRFGLPHVYLGYWVAGSRKMAYKARFLPQERLGMNGWERVD